MSFGVAFSFVRNERYADTNTLYSQYLARAHIAAALPARPGGPLPG